jgi:GMP synthase (glutamine-hydrolysing)
VKRLLLYKTGQTHPSLLPDIGDYECWFRRVLDGHATLEVHRAFDAPKHPLAGYDGMIITGSPQSLVQPEPWMLDAAELVRNAKCSGLPILGVCFGHQLIAYAFGSTVRKNPRGWEIGTTTVELTEEGRRDPLFKDLPAQLRVNQSHQDEVCELAANVRHLAGNEHTAAQSIAVGDAVRGVQFHPEMNSFVVKRIIDYRRAILQDDAANRGRAFCVDTTINKVCDTPHAESVLTNFARHFLHVAA